MPSPRQIPPSRSHRALAEKSGDALGDEDVVGWAHPPQPSATASVMTTIPMMFMRPPLR